MATQQAIESSSSSANILNDDILLRIFDYLHLDDKIRLRRTCHRWRRLLDAQLNRVRALRIGQFQQGGYSVTSGLQLDCQHKTSQHRRHTGTLFNKQLLQHPPDLDTLCHSITRYDYLHRSLKYCSSSISMLSLGRLNISYRFLMVISNNLPNLEHLELIGCASGQDESAKNGSSSSRYGTTSDTCKAIKCSGVNQLPSLESFNSEPRTHHNIYSAFLYNQHEDERVNMEERIIRSALVKNCDLVKESRTKNLWPRLKHLLVKDCNLLNEFSLCLLMAITKQTLVHLVVEYNQYLTGEFLNYCGPNLEVLRFKYCPLLQVKFLEDLVKLKQLTSPPKTTHISSSSQLATRNLTSSSTSSPLLQINQQPSSRPQPIDLSMLRNNRNFNQDLYCTL